VDGHVVGIEADIEDGPPGLLLVGLPDAAVLSTRTCPPQCSWTT